MGNKIKILGEQVANQIAAGEVVDRPASVVKELVENSLDAAATHITVEIEQGGKRLIRVSDDGVGMSREDALLSLERHATSKIRDTADLFAIQSLGFRGEALPSIASVSEMTLVTRDEESAAGLRLQITGGIIKSISEVGVPRGTEISVHRLFFNVPARRKFLKNIDTELGHITTWVSNLALAHPETHFTLLHNGRVLFDLPASRDLSDRLRHALGADTLSQLLPVHQSFGENSESPLVIHGFISVPSYSRSSTRGLHIFVNRRFVRDRLINHAVFEAYRSLLPKGRYPLVVLFLDLPAAAVDVNVHPAKHEIRFRDQAGVHQAVVATLEAALRQADRSGARLSPEKIRAFPFRGKNEEIPGHAESSPASEEIWTPRQSAPRSDSQTFADSTSAERETTPIQNLSGVAAAIRRYHEQQERNRQRTLFPEERERRERAESRSRLESLSSPPKTEIDIIAREETWGEASLPPLRFSELRLIGQVAGTYLLAESSDSLVIIDQHAAAERVRFEKLRGEFLSSSITRQPLLFPVVVDLTFQETRRVEAQQELLLRLGLEVEPFGGNTVAIKSLPALLVGVDPARLLVDLIDRLEEGGEGKILPAKLDELFSVMACHSVIRAHRSLSEPEMAALLASMDQIAFPGHCPHGREAVVRIRFRDLAKWFGR